MSDEEDQAARCADLARQLSNLSLSQMSWVQGVIGQFQLHSEYERNPASDIITAEVLERLGDALRIHHAFSRQALSKDRFEYAFENALKISGFAAELAQSRTNRGHDITVDGVKISLKTEAAAGIKKHKIHISKWMELGRGEWRLDLLLRAYLEHMTGYDRIFTMRRLQSGPELYEYELVELPRALMLEAENAVLSVNECSRQNPKPGYGHVLDDGGSLKYSLYFDGGSERKLQIKNLNKALCVVHAVWRFNSSDLG